MAQKVKVCKKLALDEVPGVVGGAVAGEVGGEAVGGLLPILVLGPVLEHLVGGLAGLEPAEHHGPPEVGLHVGLQGDGQGGEGAPLEGVHVEDLTGAEGVRLELAPGHDHVRHRGQVDRRPVGDQVRLGFT